MIARDASESDGIIRQTTTEKFRPYRVRRQHIFVKQLLTDLTIWTGAIIGALTIFDWLLSEKQKDNLRRCGEDLWLWLSDQKAGRFIRAFTALKVQFVISVALWGIANALAVADLFRSDRGESGTA